MTRSAVLAVMVALWSGDAAAAEQVCGFGTASREVADPLASLVQAVEAHCVPGDMILLPGQGSRMWGLAMATFCDFNKPVQSAPNGVVCVLAPARRYRELDPTP